MLWPFRVKAERDDYPSAKEVRSMNDQEMYAHGWSCAVRIVVTIAATIAIGSVASDYFAAQRAPAEAAAANERAARSNAEAAYSNFRTEEVKRDKVYFEAAGRAQSPTKAP